MLVSNSYLKSFCLCLESPKSLSRVFQFDIQMFYRNEDVMMFLDGPYTFQIQSVLSSVSVALQSSSTAWDILGHRL